MQSSAAQPLSMFTTLYAWSIMPNHAHVVVKPNTPMPAIMRWLKGRTSRKTNRILNRTGPFGQDESYDHWIRSFEELEDLIQYTENNPVRAGFVSAANQWPFSSA